TPQPAGDVVLSAALPHPELPGGAHTPVARIEPQHHLAEAHRVIAALARIAYGQRSHVGSLPVRPTSGQAEGALSAAIATASAVRLLMSSHRRSAMSLAATIQDPPTAATAGTAR